MEGRVLVSQVLRKFTKDEFFVPVGREGARGQYGLVVRLSRQGLPLFGLLWICDQDITRYVVVQPPQDFPTADEFFHHYDFDDACIFAAAMSLAVVEIDEVAGSISVETTTRQNLQVDEAYARSRELKRRLVS